MNAKPTVEGAILSIVRDSVSHGSSTATGTVWVGSTTTTYLSGTNVHNTVTFYGSASFSVGLGQQLAISLSKTVASNLLNAVKTNNNGLIVIADRNSGFTSTGSTTASYSRYNSGGLIYDLTG
jgi:hypothetical protein